MLSLLKTTDLFSQMPVKKPENRILVIAGSYYNFNKAGVRNDPDGPQTISVNNTVGYYVGLGYERKTRKGLLFSYDLQYKTLPQEGSISYDLERFDPRGSNYLRSLGVFRKSWNTTFKMLDNRFMIGYEHPIGNRKNGLFLQEKIGYSLSHILSGIKGNTPEYVEPSYYDNTRTDVFYTNRIMYFIENIDQTISYKEPPHRYLFSGHTINAYIGIGKSINKYGLKNISLGLEGRYSGISGPAEVYVQTNSDFSTGRGLQVDKYNSVYRSIGLQVSLNF